MLKYNKCNNLYVQIFCFNNYCIYICIVDTTKIQSWFYISAGTVDYTGGEEVRANLLKGRSSVKSEAHESLAHG